MNQKQILIVEDELIIAAQLESIIKQRQWQAAGICSCVEEALEHIRTLQPDMVLIDINLTGCREGVEIGKFLLQEDNIPFVYITSLVDEATLEKVKNTRPMGYIVKPFRKEDVFTTLDIAFCNHKHRKLDPVRNQEVVKSNVPFKLRKVIDYIVNNIDKKIEVKDLAEMTGWQTQHFIRNFKSHLGITPYKYVLQHKIDKAKRLLCDTELSISEIAYDLGFQSHSNFSTTFLRMENKTAEHYRILRRKVGLVNLI